MTTETAVSPGVPGWAVLISLLVFTIVYGALAVVEFGLIAKAAKAGPPEIEQTEDDASKVDHDRLATVY
jgi:cytochrome d ubiquinol oxidase subunit I